MSPQASASTSPSEKFFYNTIVVFGPPGSGKGTWGKILGMIPGFYHLSTGEMFRTLDTESKTGMEVMEYMGKGELVPDDIVYELWSEHMRIAIMLGTFRPQKDILVLDGFPRTPRQVGMLKQSAEVKAILLLDCDDREILVQRLRRRAVQEHRMDDANEQTIRHRFRVYSKETERILSQFPADLMEKVDVSSAPINILANISATLNRRLQQSLGA